MAKQGGLISRLIMGSEKSEGYARSTLPSNRWELFWDILKGRFGKLVIVNLLIIMFFLPLAGLLFFRYSMLVGYGTVAPFSQGFGVGYQALPSINGMAESIILNVDLIMYAFLPLALMIAAIGVAGGAYVIRNMVWTEGIFVANDFWRGIRLNGKELVLYFLIYSVFLYLGTISMSMANQISAMGNGSWLITASKILVIIFMIFATMVLFHLVSMAVTYKMKFFGLFKNAFMFTLGLFPQTIFFLLLASIPIVLIFIGGIVSTIGYIILILIGMSYMLLVWTDFSHWAYDKFVNDKVPGAKKGRGIYERIKDNDSKSLKQYREQMEVVGRSSLSSKPIKPITDDEITIAELPTAFTRDDINRLNASKQAMYEDNERYIEEHKNDPEYQMTPEEEEMEKRKIEREKRIEKAKKELRKNK